MLQLKIDVFLYMSLLLYTTESCTSEENKFGFRFDNQSTIVHTYRHQTVYHFEEQSDSSDKVLFSSYGHISVSDGISSSSLSNAELIAGSDVENGGYKEGIGDHARFRGITDFCQNGTHIIVVDKMNHCIRAIYYDNGKGNNLTTTLAGKCGKNDNGYIDSDASSALFDKPHSILITKSENTFLYLVTDTGNNAIRLIDADKEEVTTFVNASAHLIEPIDLIFSQDLSTLYVTTRSGLTTVKIQTRQICTIHYSNNFGSLYKMTWFTNDAYLMSDYGDNKLIVFYTKNNIVFWIRTINQHLYEPRGVFFSRKNSAIIVGASQHIQRLNVSGKICNNANLGSEALEWNFTTSTTINTTSTTTSTATSSKATTTTTSSTTSLTTSSNTSSTTSSTTNSESTARDNSTEKANKPETTTNKGLDERNETHLFIIYGIVGLITILLLLVIVAILRRRPSRQHTQNTRHLLGFRRGTRRQLPARPGAPSSITTISTHYDQIHLRNSGLSSESGTHTNHLHSMSNGSPQVPMRTNRRNTDGYTPMHVNPESVYTRMNNAVYQNIQPEGIRLLPTEPVAAETEMYTDDVYNQRQ